MKFLHSVVALAVLALVLGNNAFGQAPAPADPTLTIGVDADTKLSVVVKAPGKPDATIAFGKFNPDLRDAELVSWVDLTTQARGIDLGGFTAADVVARIRAFYKEAANVKIAIGADNSLEVEYSLLGVAQPKINFGPFNPKASDKVLVGWITQVLKVRGIDLKDITPTDIVGAVRAYYKAQEDAKAEADRKAAFDKEVKKLTDQGIDQAAAVAAVLHSRQAEAQTREILEAMKANQAATAAQFDAINRKIAELEKAGQATSAEVARIKTALETRSAPARATYQPAVHVPQPACQYEWVSDGRGGWIQVCRRAH